MTITIERGSLAHAGIYLPLRALVNALEALYAILAAVCGHWRPIAIAAALAGAVALCAACPALPLGLAITAAVGFVTYPRTAVK